MGLMEGDATSGGEPSAARGSDAVALDLRFWNRLYCLAFDDVAREICAVGGGGDPRAAEAHRLTAHLMRCLASQEPPHPDPLLSRHFDRVVRGALFVRFGERILHWMDRLADVDDEYERRIGVLRERRLTAEDLRPYVDRGSGTLGADAAD